MAKKFPKHWMDTIVVQPMDFAVLVVRPSSLAMFIEHMEHHKCDKHFQADVHEQIASVQSGGASFYSSESTNILFLPDEWDDIVVFHEALHCAVHLWDIAGANLQLPDNDEVLTYTQGHVVNLLKKKFYPEKKKKCQSKK